MGYYEELAQGGDDVRMAGWRRRVEQSLRFEVALQEVSLGGVRSLGRVLDAGCGTGALAGYMNRTGRAFGSYLGVDRLEHSVMRAKECEEEKEGVSFLCGDVCEVEGEFDTVFAIGTLVDGVDVLGDRDRKRRVYGMVRALLEKTRGVMCLMVLDQAHLLEDAWRSQEKVLMGAFREELDAMMRVLSQGEEERIAWWVRDDFLRTDLALVVSYEGVEPVREERWSAHERVLRGEEPVECAWLWAQAGAWERARVCLQGEEGEEARLLRERITMWEG